MRFKPGRWVAMTHGDQSRKGVIWHLAASGGPGRDVAGQPLVSPLPVPQFDNGVFVGSVYPELPPPGFDVSAPWAAVAVVNEATGSTEIYACFPLSALSVLSGSQVPDSRKSPPEQVFLPAGTEV